MWCEYHIRRDRQGIGSKEPAFWDQRPAQDVARC
jgi:hypothetical protein